MFSWCPRWDPSSPVATIRRLTDMVRFLLPPTHSIFSEVYLSSKYSNAPVRLKYEEKDTDSNSLDAAWETILKTLKY